MGECNTILSAYALYRQLRIVLHSPNKMVMCRKVCNFAEITGTHNAQLFHLQAKLRLSKMRVNE